MFFGFGERIFIRYFIDIYKNDSVSFFENGMLRGSDNLDSVDQMKLDRRESIDK